MALRWRDSWFLFASQRAGRHNQRDSAKLQDT